MDSLNSFEVQAKKPVAEERAYRRQSLRRIAIIAVSSFLLLLIVAAVTAIALDSGNFVGKSVQTVANTNPVDSIKAVCSTTLYPDSCYSSISSAREPNTTVENPKVVFKLSVQVALTAVSEANSVSNLLSDGFDNSAVIKAARRDCRELLSSAAGHLNETLVILQAATATRISDIRALLSAAVADQVTCAEGMSETSMAAAMAKATVNATEYTSNSLAIATKFGNYIELTQSPFINRKLLAELEDLSRRFLWNLTVAKDGTGDLETISAALEKVPEKSMIPFVIYVKEGVYEEYVVVGKRKWNVVMVGDGMNRTIVAGSRNRVDGSTAYSSATFTVQGRGFIAVDMTFMNTAGPEKKQAAAVLSKSDRSIFLRCSFIAFHNTLYPHSLRQFYRDCSITGTTDFIYGDAAVVFQNCSIQPKKPLPGEKNAITVQTRSDPNQSTGISIQSCSIKGEISATPTYLGRQGNKFSRTAVMTTEIGEVVVPEGWLEKFPGGVPPDTIFVGEYRNSGPGAGLGGRVGWPGYKPMMSVAEAEHFSVKSLIQGDAWIHNQPIFL